MTSVTVDFSRDLCVPKMYKTCMKLEELAKQTEKLTPRQRRVVAEVLQRKAWESLPHGLNLVALSRTSPVVAFVQQRCVVIPGVRCTIEDLWKEWTDHSPLAETAATPQVLGRLLKSFLPMITTRQMRLPGGGRFRLFDGLGLLSQLGPPCAE